jgi:creatinine amidohydrolase
MLWEELTAKEFSIALEESKYTCVLPMGVIEKHGEHLPVGTDMYIARNLAEKVAEVEPVMVFPYYFFGQIAEARHCPGTISIRPDLLSDILEETCQEIYRNGFKKIIFLNTHGGNFHFLRNFAQNTLYKKKEYAVYVIGPSMDDECSKEIKEMFGGNSFGSHAGNHETSEILSIRPELVKMEQADPKGFNKYDQLKNMDGIFTAIYWYADHPTHQAGDPTSASAEAGKKSDEYTIKNLADKIRKIKDDENTIRLQNEFFSQCQF